MIKALIFDLDGTLVDTLTDLRTGINAMLTKLGYRTRTAADILNFINHGSKELVRRSLPKEVQNIDFILESAMRIYDEEYAKCHCNETKPYIGVESMLMELKGMGYKIGVLSNKQDAFVKDIVYKFFDKKIFSAVMGQRLLPPKPNPASAYLLSKLMSVKPSRCIFIGDSDVDLKTAENAGMKHIGVTWGFRDEKFLKKSGVSNLAHTPDDVVALVQKTAEAEMPQKRHGK